MKYAILLLVLLIPAAMAETCFTILNSPTNYRAYFRAQSYDTINDGTSGYLVSTERLTANVGLGVGYQYNIRVDKNCFENYLPSTLDMTGISSGTMIIQNNHGDYKSADNPAGKMYTISRKTRIEANSRAVKDISTGNIDGINYFQMPGSFSSPMNHPEYAALHSGLCNSNLKITDQLYNIMGAVWSELAYADSVSCGSADLNQVDCALEQGFGSSLHYSMLVALLARQCGVPVRVVRGVSEGTFDGIDIKFSESKIHYWIEFYDLEWYMMDVTEDAKTGPTTVEVNCVDFVDNDKDGFIDCRDDDCSIAGFCQGAYPTTTKFYNTVSTDISTLPNVYRIPDLTLGNSFGKVTWTGQGLDLRDQNLDNGLDISFNQIAISALVPELHKPAIATLNGVIIASPVISKNSLGCSACNIISYSANVIVFNITGPGIYKAVESSSLVNDNVLNTTNATVTNISALPPIPTDLTSGTDGIMGKLTGIKDWFLNLSTLGKVVLGGVVFGVIYLFMRSRKPQYPGYVR